MGYTVYGANVSPFVRKVRVALMEKGVPFDFQIVNPMQPPPQWRELSPLGKIPAFTDGDRKLADSSVICLYLERREPNPPLYPRDDYEHARALWFEEYIDSGMAPQLVGPIFGPLVIRPLLLNTPATREIKAEAMKLVESVAVPMWTYLEQQLGPNEFFAGGAFSIADIAVASAHVNLKFTGIDVDRRKFPRLAAFLERMYARPSFAKCIAEESPRWDRRAAIAEL
jgi:glutathione S-transferase